MRASAAIFAGWTLLVWISRVRNVIADDDLSAGGQAWRVTVAVVLVGLAVMVFATRARSRPILMALVVVTAGVWLVRGVGILVDEHGASFKIVHSVLALASIALALWAAGTSVAFAQGRIRNKPSAG